MQIQKYDEVFDLTIRKTKEKTKNKDELVNSLLKFKIISVYSKGLN
jgi:hypothetical protein